MATKIDPHKFTSLTVGPLSYGGYVVTGPDGNYMVFATDSREVALKWVADSLAEAGPVVETPRKRFSLDDQR